jgi:hypothetical protein
MKFLVLLVLAMAASASAKPMPDTMSVGMAMMNYADSDARRNVGAVPIAVAVENLKLNALRFPGGLEASSYIWATAPTWTPDSHTPAFTNTSRWPLTDTTIVSDGSFVNVVNFDEFMAIAGDREVSIVINFGSMYTDDGPSKELLIETARQWVRYAKQNFNNTFYWEIGNESDLKNAAYNGHPPNGGQYGLDFIDFAEAMREEDPDATIGMNGSYEDFMFDVLNIAGDHIDFMVIHPFPINKFANGYEDFVAGDGDFNERYDLFESAVERSFISSKKKRDIFAMVTETGVVDWSTHWENTESPQPNNIAHMIMMADVLGRYIEMPKIRGPIFAWGSHWVVQNETTAIYSLLDQNNDPEPTAYAMYLWASLGDIVSAERVELDGGVIQYTVLTTNGTSTVVINTSGNDIDMPVSVAFHNEDVSWSDVIGSTDLTTLPKFSIALI